MADLGKTLALRVFGNWSLEGRAWSLGGSSGSCLAEVEGAAVKKGGARCLLPWDAVCPWPASLSAVSFSSLTGGGLGPCPGWLLSGSVGGP